MNNYLFQSEGFRNSFFLSRAASPESFNRRYSFLLKQTAVSVSKRQDSADFSDLSGDGYAFGLNTLFSKISLLESADARRKFEQLCSARLSRRESEVAVFLAAGINPKQIAVKLEIQVTTVERHIANVYRKLNIHRKSELPVF